jgi:hypothetical protein
MIGYLALVSLFPRLDTPQREAAWNAYWRPGVARRVLPGALAALLVCGSVPARAAGAPTFDIMAYGQRAAEFLKNEWRFVWDQNVSVEKKLRDAALAYSAYRQARDIYERIKDGNVLVSLQNALPVVEMESDLGNGQQETITLRPVFNARQRSIYGAYHGPKVLFDIPNLANLDIDVDRNVVTVNDPTKNMSPQQIAQQAEDDAWMSWTLAQQSNGLDRVATQTPYSGATGYNELVGRLQSARADRVKRLQDIARLMLNDYGEDSVQYAQAMDAYTAAIKASSDGTADQTDQAVVARLNALDAEAQRALDKYAANNQSMLMAQKRENNTSTQVNAISAKYDSGTGKPWNIGQFMDIFGQIGALQQTLGAMNAGNKSQAPISKEPLGNQQKATVLMRWVGDNTNEALKLQARKAQEEAQTDMLRAGQEKAQVLADVKAQQDAQDARDAAIAAQTKVAQILALMQGLTFAALQPTGLTPIVPDTTLTAGAATNAVGSAGADDAIKANMKIIGQKAANKLASDIPQAIQDSGTTLSWGLLRPLARALDAGSRTVLHKSFNLTNWTGN